MVAELKADGPTVIVDAGGSLARASVRPTESLEAVRAAARVMAEGMVLGGLDAAAVGKGEWTILGFEGLSELAHQTGYPLLAANLVCGEEHPFPGHKVVEAGGRKIGIVGVTSGTIEGCTVTDPLEAVRAELAAMPDTDYRVVLLPVRGREATAFEDAVLDAQLIVDGAAGKRRQVAEPFGELALVSSGSRGKYLGVVSLQWVEGGEGWQILGRGAALGEEITRLERRIESARGRVEGATDDVRRERYTRQVERYEGMLTEKRAALEAASAPAQAKLNRIEASTVALDSGVDSHPATAAMVAAYKDAWPTLENAPEPGSVDRPPHGRLNPGAHPSLNGPPAAPVTPDGAPPPLPTPRLIPAP